MEFFRFMSTMRRDMRERIVGSSEKTANSMAAVMSCSFSFARTKRLWSESMKRIGVETSTFLTSKRYESSLARGLVLGFKGEQSLTSTPSSFILSRSLGAELKRRESPSALVRMSRVSSDWPIISWHFPMMSSSLSMNQTIFFLGEELLLMSSWACARVSRIVEKSWALFFTLLSGVWIMLNMWVGSIHLEMVKDRDSPEGWSKVDHWLGRVSPETAERTLPIFRSWMRWVAQTGSKFADYTPDQLVEYQLQSDNGSRYDILDLLVQPYVRQKRGRIGYKRKIYGTVRSFFAHNRVELPKDPGFILRPEKEKVQGTLTVDELRNLVLSSSPVYQAVFLSMFQGGLGLEEFEYWNLNGWDQLKAQLDEKVMPVRVDLPGRKKSRNIRPYHTYLGTDAVNAVRNYVDNFRPEKPTYTFPESHEREGQTVTPIFVNKFEQPVMKHALYLYWIRHLRKIGILGARPKGGPSEGHRTGKNPHEVRDLFRSQWEKAPNVKMSMAEYCLGHVVDPLDYNKAYKDERWAQGEYRKAMPLLNIISDDRPFGKVGEDEIEMLRARIQELEKEKREYTIKYEDIMGRMDKLDEISRQFKEHLKQEK